MTFKIFCNEMPKSVQTADRVRELLTAKGFAEVERGCAERVDVCFAIGGDGSFLRMVRESGFCPTTKFVGINTGTLGFLQGVKSDEVDEFINNMDGWIEQELGYIEVEAGGEIFRCLNEVIIRCNEHKVVDFGLSVDDGATLRIVGDGVCISSSVGSSAHNLSLGGSLVPYNVDSLQITPIAPIASVAYRNLISSVVLSAQSRIVATWKKDNIAIVLDGYRREVDAKSISVYIGGKITCVSLRGYDFFAKVVEKITG
jgi:NAD+ kinase